MDDGHRANLELREEAVLLDRFVLQRCLRPSRTSPLWVARDRAFDTSLLVRVHPRSLEDRVVEAIRRGARQHRGLRHPHVARINDLHETDELLLLSIDAAEGELLSSVLERTGPLPFRDMVGRVRPLVEALLELQESGGAHGRVDPHHVLVDGDSRWMLLPADGTAPSAADTARLGQLLASTLTGSAEPLEGRELNERPERLHQGRAVPALLNQLVSDLSAAGARPGGMRDLLQRLDQLERFMVPVAAPAEPTPASEPASKSEAKDPAASATLATDPTTVIHRPVVAAPSTPRPRAKPRRSRARWLVVPVLIAAGAVLMHPAVVERLTRDAPEQQAVDTETPAPPVVEASTPRDGGTPPNGIPPKATPPSGTTPAAAPDQPEPAPVDAAAFAQERAKADEALNGYLTARREADDVGAATWGGEAYGDAAAMASEADRAFLDQQFGAAAERYGEATEAFRELFEMRGEAMGRLLLEGLAALETPDAELAAASFRGVLLIDPGNEQASAGLQRASTLDELNELLAAARSHEQGGRLAFAHADYSAAVKLDPRSEEAAAAFQRVKDALADEQFRALMSRALEAFHEGDYPEARVRLGEARDFRPGASEVEEAFEMVAEAELREELDRLRLAAVDAEQQDRWQEAWNVYRQVLAMDPNIQFAQDGKSRCELIIRLQKHVDHYLANPELLTQAEAREDAKRLVEQLEDVPVRGLRLQHAYARLAEQVRLANTPLRVSLESDDKTEVAVYKVGQYGTFNSVQLDLLPGEYTVVGTRRGYKDVRLTLRLKLGETEATLRVVCTERI